MSKENTVYGIVGHSKNIETGEITESRFTHLFSTVEEAERSLINIGFELQEDSVSKYFTRKADEVHPDRDLEQYVVEFFLPKKMNGENEYEKRSY